MSRRSGFGGHRRKAATATVLLAAALCALSASAASAQADAFTWLGPTSLVSIGGVQNIPAVSCPSTSQCTTVDGKGQEITFNPANGAIITRSAVDIIGTVSSISCPSSAQCTAVDNGGNEITFSPTTGAVNLAGRANITPGHHAIAVSCASGTRCTAVDDHGSEVTFDPSSGSVVGGSGTSIDGTTALTGVSCQPGTVTGTQQCTAVDSGGTQITFVVADDGSVTTSSSTGIDGTTALTSVSCPDTTVCAAVDGNGYEVTFTPSTGALVGTATQIDTNASAGVALNSVSCPTTSQCVAVDALGNEVTFSPSATPSPSVNSIDGTTFLASVSCPAGASNCVATDNHGNEIDFTTAGAANSFEIVAPVLAGVACPTRTQCTVIASGPSEVTLDPTTGTINSAGVKPIDVSGNPLTGISCISATECTVVDSGGNEITFDPTTGNIVANGSVSIDATGLRSVSCLLTSGANPAPQCTAIDSAGNEVTFNPSTSAINNAGLSPVDPSGGIQQAVSCPTGIQCTAVDSQGNEVTFNPVTGIYYGTQRYVTVDPGQNTDGLACPTAGQCTAVDRAGGIITFLNPADTPAIPTRQVIEVSNTPLTSVACPSATQCTAVDGLGQEATFSPADTSLSPVLLTPLAEANALQAVACQSTSICYTVDAEGNGFAGIEPPVNTALPTITGTAQEGVQLTAVQGKWTNFPTGYSYQWEDCTSPTDTSTCSVVSGPTSSSTYTPAISDIGQYIRVQEQATNPGGAPQVLSSATTKVLPAVPTNTAAPTVSGSPVQQGQPLTEAHGTWHEDASDPLTYTYKWEDCDTAGANCTPIAGATAQTYTPTTSDIGHEIVVVETAANSGGTSAPVASAPTTAIAGAPHPAIQAVTLAARPVQATTATVQAQLVTLGLPVSWYFMYGTSTRHLSSSRVLFIPAGAASVTVNLSLSRLKPNTTYHYVIVETMAASAYLPQTTVSGQYRTFTTRTDGKILLSGRRLPVTAAGRISVPVSCSSSLACAGHYSISAVKANGSTVGCASGSLRLKAHHAVSIETGVSGRCLHRLRSAARHRLSATFTVKPQTGQLGLTKKITIVLH